MKKKVKKMIFLIVVSIILGLLFPLHTNFIVYQYKNNGHLESDDISSLEKAAFWEIGPIEIDDDNPTKNWSLIKATYDWCSGSGNWNDPFKIENVTINGLSTGSCIEIKNSNAFFIIRNCTLYNSGLMDFDAGISLNNTKNGFLLNNNCSDNGNSGIRLYSGCENITVSGNNANSNTKYGLKLDHSSNNTISTNYAYNNEFHGIELNFSDNNDIIKNNIRYSTVWEIFLQCSNENNIIENDYRVGYSGMYLNNSNNNFIVGNLGYKSSGSTEDYIIKLENCSWNNVSGNYIGSYNSLAENTHGIYMDTCNYSIISKNVGWVDGRSIRLINCLLNNITSNEFSSVYGILMESSSNNSILSNKIGQDKTGGGNVHGITIGDESNDNIIFDNYIRKDSLFGGIGISTGGNFNLVYFNVILGAGDHAFSIGVNNKWDNGSIGNYWSDYSGVDANDDGIGDTPYGISGGVQDYYPIWDDGDDIAPQFIINSPIVNETFGTNPPEFNITIIERYSLDEIWYTIDEGITNYTTTELTGLINQIPWKNKGEGDINLLFYANDSIGHIGFIIIPIIKNLSAPVITIDTPMQSELYGITTPSFSLIIDGLNIHSKWYSLNGGENITFTTTSQIDQAEWNKCGNGTVIIKFYVNNSLGNCNFSEVTVRKDAYIPVITIHAPILDETFGNNPPQFRISIIGDDLTSSWYNLEGVAGTFPFTELNGTINQAAWDDAPTGEITITFYALDRAGNIGTESIIVMKRVPSQPAIIGYNIFLLIGAISLVSIIIMKKLKH